MNRPDRVREFYDSQYTKDYAARGESAAVRAMIETFVSRFGLSDALVLEVGCGRGAYQRLARGWVGADLSLVAAREAGKRALACRATALPFSDATFDAVWTVQMLEHVSEPEEAMTELARILRPGGVACIAPAWHCRPWTRDGVEVRSWKDLDWKLRIVKIVRPIRELRFVRAATVLLARIVREVHSRAHLQRPSRLRVVRLRPNYEQFWQADSDATVALDQHEMIRWFRSRGWHVFDAETTWSRISYNRPEVIVRSPGHDSGADAGCGTE